MKLYFTKEWLERRIELEGDHEIGAGFHIEDVPPEHLRSLFGLSEKQPSEPGGSRANKGEDA